LAEDYDGKFYGFEHKSIRLSYLELWKCLSFILSNYLSNLHRLLQWVHRLKNRINDPIPRIVLAHWIIRRLLVLKFVMQIRLQLAGFIRCSDIFKYPIIWHSLLQFGLNANFITNILQQSLSSPGLYIECKVLYNCIIFYLYSIPEWHYFTYKTRFFSLQTNLKHHNQHKLKLIKHFSWYEFV